MPSRISRSKSTRSYSCSWCSAQSYSACRTRNESPGERKGVSGGKFLSAQVLLEDRCLAHLTVCASGSFRPVHTLFGVFAVIRVVVVRIVVVIEPALARE